MMKLVGRICYNASRRDEGMNHDSCIDNGDEEEKTDSRYIQKVGSLGLGDFQMVIGKVNHRGKTLGIQVSVLITGGLMMVIPTNREYR